MDGAISRYNATVAHRLQSDLGALVTKRRWRTRYKATVAHSGKTHVRSS